MTASDVRKAVEEAVSNAMHGQESFARNYQRLTQEGQEPTVTIEHRNAQTRIAIYSELKGIRIALTEIADLMASNAKK
jgi:hypothetical protein